ncbi:MAG TPA: hypothetical protein VFT22_24290 [Kofleriaceae bacterium]|nr:hypothetical protein [Kofleriaceae bacterium]
MRTHRRPSSRDRAEPAPRRELEAAGSAAPGVAADRPANAPPPAGTTTSGLSALVEAEARLDRALDAAREAAIASVAAARRRAEDDAATIDAEIARERARIDAEITTATTAQLAAIAEQARAQAARFDAVRGEALARLGHALAHRLAAIARGEGAP